MAPPSRQVTKAPEKGIFPLDHFAECKKLADAYTACIKQHEGDSQACHALSVQYLQCRMDRNLMAKQSMEELGMKGPLANGATAS